MTATVASRSSGWTNSSSGRTQQLSARPTEHSLPGLIESDIPPLHVGDREEVERHVEKTPEVTLLMAVLHERVGTVDHRFSIAPTGINRPDRVGEIHAEPDAASRPCRRHVAGSLGPNRGTRNAAIFRMQSLSAPSGSKLSYEPHPRLHPGTTVAWRGLPRSRPGAPRVRRSGGARSANRAPALGWETPANPLSGGGGIEPTTAASAIQPVRTSSRLPEHSPPGRAVQLQLESREVYMTEPEWGDFKVLLALGRAGSVAGAARILGVDGSTVSRRLAAAEKAAGAVLIVRGGRAFAFTKEGQTLLDAAETMDAGHRGSRLGASVESRAAGHRPACGGAVDGAVSGAVSRVRCDAAPRPPRRAARRTWRDRPREGRRGHRRAGHPRPRPPT